jgi:ribonuclease HI
MERKIFKLGFHSARHTVAKTGWEVNGLALPSAEEQGLVKVLYISQTNNKTHYFALVEALRSDLKFTRIRVSNRGNITTQEFTIEQMEQFKPTKEELKFLEGVRE